VRPCAPQFIFARSCRHRVSFRDYCSVSPNKVKRQTQFPVEWDHPRFDSGMPHDLIDRGPPCSRGALGDPHQCHSARCDVSPISTRLVMPGIATRAGPLLETAEVPRLEASVALMANKEATMGIWQTCIESARAPHCLICSKVVPPQFPRTRRNVAVVVALLSKLPEAIVLSEQGTD
jgi:hypothetical protein